MVRAGKPLDAVKDVLKEIDYVTLLLLTGLFVVIAGISEAGVVDAIGRAFASLAGGNVFVAYSLIVWASVLFSAFIDNIPYVATMLPVTAVIAGHLGVHPTVLYFGLLVGATLGGNLTPIGASANITGIGILRKNGYEVGNWDFMKISIPFTLCRRGLRLCAGMAAVGAGRLRGQVFYKSFTRVEFGRTRPAGGMPAAFLPCFAADLCFFERF